MATCPKCAQSFEAVDPDKEPAPAPPSAQQAAAAHQPAAAQQGAAAAKPRVAIEPEDEEEEEEQSPVPSWVSPWGAASFGPASLAMVLAVVLGSRLLTVALALVGVALVWVGIRATQEDRKTRDRVWFYLGGALNGLILILVLFLPGALNNWWALDRPAPPREPNKQVRVPRDRTQEEGQPLTEDDWSDAATDALRQDNLLVRVESVKAGQLADKGTGSYLLVHLRLANVGQGEPIPFEGFGSQHQPKLTGDGGAALAFQEQRLRKPARGALVFEATGPRVVEVQPTIPQDLLLIFESPPSRFEELRLEIPSSAWGRKGMCKWRISALFDSGLPDKK
jgi:hypothetical protein